jgi:hypothetical protein
MTASEELEKIDAAIAAILDGKVAAVGGNGRNAQFLSLDALYKRKAQLEATVSRQSRGMFQLARMRRPE